MDRYVGCDTIIESEGKILVIEEINLLSYLYTTVNRKKYTHIYSIHEGKFFKVIKKVFLFRHDANLVTKISYSDFPQLYFDGEKEGYFHGIDLLYKFYKNNIYIKIALLFCNNHPYAESALKKALFSLYTNKRIETQVLLKHITECSRHVTIHFLPVDDNTITFFISENALPKENVQIPPTYRTVLRIILFCKAVLTMVSIPLIGIWLVMTGLKKVSMKKRVSHHYSFAMDMFTYGINWKRAWDGPFIYDTNQFHPSHILQVLRGQFDDSTDAKLTKQYYERYGIPYVEPHKIPFSLPFFVKTILYRFFLCSIYRCIAYLFSSNFDPQPLKSSVSLMWQTINLENFYDNYDIDVFIARDEYSSKHIIRTMVAESRGKKTFGFSHGDDCHHTEYMNLLVFSAFGVWGDFSSEYLAKSLKQSRVVTIGAGPYGLDKTHQLLEKGYKPEKYKEILKKCKIISIFGSSVSPSYYHTRKDVNLQFFEDVLSATDEYTGFIRVIRPKSDEFDDPDFQALLNNYDRVILEDSLWTYRLLCISDLVIAINTTTTGLESLMAGKKVLYYNISGSHIHVYAKYADFLVSYTKEELKCAVDRVLKQNLYLTDEVTRQITTSHGYTFDGRVTDRIKNTCLELLSEVNENRDDAISQKK